MKIKDLLEDVSAGTVSSVVAGDIAAIPNPYVTNPYRSGKVKTTKPKKVKPTDNALNMDVSLFGGAKIKR
jgi:hypothetical protein